MKACPKCDKPMRVARSRSTANPRQWVCTDYRCGDIVLFSDNEKLSTADIADQMARELFSSSDEQRKKQAAYRRAAGALNNIRDECPYLGPQEEDVLRAAATVLARFGDAAEKAKKVKKKIEEDDARRRATRRQEAFDAVGLLKEGDDPIALVKTALTLAHALDKHASYYLIDADRINRQSGQSFRNALIQASRHAIHEHIGEAADTVAWREETPVETLAEKLQKQIVHNQAQVATEHGALLARYAELLEIETAGNVVTLPTKDR